MIVKDLEPQQHADPLRRAGYDAERQMAHYLRRAFAEDPRKFVFHNLRLERGGEVAQIDHLILHRFGLLIIESKSVAGQVSVNEHGEWTRWWNRQGRGMPSPVLQARRQLDLLLALLDDHTTELMDRSMLGLKQRTLSGVRRDVLVAISDGGRITRKADVPELVKADQVPDRVRAVMVSHGGFPKIDLEHEVMGGRLVPASLNKSIVTTLLRQELGYRHLVITDDLEMGAILKHCPIEEAAKSAFNAGEDMILICSSVESVRKSYREMLAACHREELSEVRLNESLVRIAEIKSLLSEPLLFDSDRITELSAEVQKLNEKI